LAIWDPSASQADPVAVAVAVAAAAEAQAAT